MRPYIDNYIKTMKNPITVTDRKQIHLNTDCQSVRLKVNYEINTIGEFFNLHATDTFRKLSTREAMQNVLGFENLSVFEYAFAAKALYLDEHPFQCYEMDYLNMFYRDDESEDDAKEISDTPENRMKIEECLKLMDERSNGMFSYRLMDKELMELYTYLYGPDLYTQGIPILHEHYSGKDVILIDALAEVDESGISPTARLFEALVDVKSVTFVTIEF